MSRENPFNVDVFIDTAPLEKETQVVQKPEELATSEQAAKERFHRQDVSLKAKETEAHERFKQENTELKNIEREAIERFQEERAEFLGEITESRLQSILQYLKHEGPNWIPYVGTVKMYAEAFLKKTSSGQDLTTGKQRIFHALAPTLTALAYTAFAYDNWKSGVAASTISSGLTIANSLKDKEFAKKGLAFAREKASAAKDAANIELAEFLKAVNMALSQIDVSDLSEQYSGGLVMELENAQNE